MEDMNIESYDDSQVMDVESQETTDVEEVAEEQESATEEVAEPQKTTQSAEENAKFAAIRREAEAKAKERAEQEYNKQIANMYGEYGITNLQQLREAIEKQREEQRLQELLENNVPEEYAREMLENKKFREKYESESKAKSAEEASRMMYQEFMSEFPDVKSDDIPIEVWQAVDSGKNLTDAYARYLAKNSNTLKTQAQQEAIKAIKENAETSTGSINAQSTSEPELMSAEQINQTLNKMSASEQAKWIDKNYSMIEKSGYFKKF